MSAADLRAWIEGRGLPHIEAARLLALSLQGLRHQLYGERPVSPQTQRIIDLLSDRGV